MGPKTAKPDSRVARTGFGLDSLAASDQENSSPPPAIATRL